MNPALITTLTTSIVAIVGAVTALVKAWRSDAKAQAAKVSAAGTRAALEAHKTNTVGKS